MEIPSVELPHGRLPLLGLGTWKLTGPLCESAVKKALKLGYRHLDTAEFYKNEAEIGKVIQRFPREELFLTSKVWGDHFYHDDVLSACQNSLARLGSDHLDLYLLHYYPDEVPLEEPLSAMKELYDEGRILNAGVSNFNQAQMEEALNVADFPLSVNQVEFHPYLYQKELLEYCAKRRIHVTAYCPVGRGMIFQDPVLQGIAADCKKTVPQVSLRWLLQHGLSVIPKASEEAHLQENVGVFGWSLNREQMDRIDSLGVKKRLVPLG